MKQLHKINDQYYSSNAIGILLFVIAFVMWLTLAACSTTKGYPVGYKQAKAKEARTNPVKGYEKDGCW